jgi:hypothetical protein
MPRHKRQIFPSLPSSYQEYVRAIRHRSRDMGLSNSCDGNMRLGRGHKGRKERTIFWTSATLWDSPLDILRRNFDVTELTVDAVLDNDS